MVIKGCSVIEPDSFLFFIDQSLIESCFFWLTSAIQSLWTIVSPYMNESLSKIMSTYCRRLAHLRHLFNPFHWLSRSSSWLIYERRLSHRNLFRPILLREVKTQEHTFVVGSVNPALYRKWHVGIRKFLTNQDMIKMCFVVGQWGYNLDQKMDIGSWNGFEVAQIDEFV